MPATPLHEIEALRVAHDCDRIADALQGIISAVDGASDHMDAATFTGHFHFDAWRRSLAWYRDHYRRAATLQRRPS
jgi:hypothetical protein